MRNPSAQRLVDPCAFKDVYSNRILGRSIDARMKSRLAVAAVNNAVARRDDGRLRGSHRQ